MPYRPGTPIHPRVVKSVSVSMSMKNSATR
jgi:hypothetical protein